MKKEEKNKDWCIAKFEEFLKENECYEEFVKNTLTLNSGYWKTIEEYYNSIESIYEYFVCSAFIYINMKQKDFWKEINKKWQSRYEELISEEN